MPDNHSGPYIEEQQRLLYDRSPTPLCRICYEDGDLVSCCECTGTAGYVHKKCLKNWITHSGNDTHCEICKGEWTIDVFTTVDRGYLMCKSITFCFLFYCNIGLPVLFFNMALKEKYAFDAGFLWFITQGTIGIVTAVYYTMEMFVFRFIFTIIWTCLLTFFLLQDNGCQVDSIWYITVGEIALWVFYGICSLCRVDERLMEI